MSDKQLWLPLEVTRDGTEVWYWQASPATIGPSPLPHKEHDARAAVLGMSYDWRDGTYYRSTGDPSNDSWRPFGDMVDAYTLETVDHDTAARRRTAWKTGGGAIRARSRLKTPYASEE